MKIQYKHYSLSVILCSIVLVGCGGSSNNSSNNNTNSGTTTTTTTTNEDDAISKKFATQTVNNEARYIDGASVLKKDLNTLFGDANAVPIELKKGETLNAIFDRLGS
jgi:uncharacterized lipoprotein YehR (DUF1307 family)